MLAAFSKALNATRDAAAKDVAAAAAAAAAKDPEVDAGPDLPALAQAAGYGDRPRGLWPTKAMLTALNRATKGDKGSPVPWADPKAAPWYDPTWSKGEVDPDDDHLRALGQQAEDLGFAGLSSELVTRQAFNVAWLAPAGSAGHPLVGGVGRVGPGPAVAVACLL